jgi:ABC-type sugar transport system permease subunit
MNSLLALVCSFVLFVIGFQFIARSTDWGMDKAMLVLAEYQNVKSDTTDIFGSFINSEIWSYKIEGILFIFLGMLMLYLANSLRSKK